MSDYTTQLRWPVEHIQRETMSDPDDYSKCYHALGLDTYPIFDESYRAQLNDKIIRHFYFREIGFETLAQFRWYVRNTMFENMPYFNQLYESLNLITDPITNQSYTWGEAYSLEQGGNTTTNTESSNEGTQSKTEVMTYGKTSHDVTETAYGRNQHTVNGGSDEVTEGGVHERVIREDTPMNLIPNGAIENLNYATDVTYTDRNGTSAGITEYGGTTDISNGGKDTTTSDGRTGGSDTRTTNGATTDEGSGRTDFSRELDESGQREHNRSGYDGVSPSDLLKKYRDTFLNVDMQVIASLETCFFGLWN